MKAWRCAWLGHRLRLNYRGRPECARCGYVPRFATPAEHAHAQRFIRGR